MAAKTSSRLRLIAAACLLASAQSFAPPMPLAARGIARGAVARRVTPLRVPAPPGVGSRAGIRAASGVRMNVVTAAVNEAFAALFALPVLKTKAVALVHPIAFGTLYLLMLYTGVLGWHWRSVRTMSPGLERSKVLKDAVKSKDRHFRLGSILLGLSITFAVEGCLNTWVRAGRLFATPHLFAGAGVAVLFSLSAATVPYMQSNTSGSSAARVVHMALNALIVLLFTWQLFTGWGILQKVWEFVPWTIAAPAPPPPPVALPSAVPAATGAAAPLAASPPVLPPSP